MEVIFVLLICLVASASMAAITLHSLFTDNAVLQQQQRVPVWGWADDGECVRVECQGQNVETNAKNGRWLVKLLPLTVGGPFEMKISGASGEVVTREILVGEVWLCSGQSNMQWPLNDTKNAQQAIESSEDDQLRLFTVPRIPQKTPIDDVDSQWVVCDPENVFDFSAVAYYFGRELRKVLNVPVGLINSSYGGSIIEAWSGDQLPDDDYLQMMWNAGEIYRNPPHLPHCLYNGMIKPLQPYAMKGVIWYQGESNVFQASHYSKRFSLMIKNWRDDWGQGDFPFLFVQLAPFNAGTDGDWAELRESQHLTTHTVNTAMAVITDVGDADDIHPKEKETVGVRLSLAARAMAYGQDVVYQSPIYRTMTISEGRVEIEFDHTVGGLKIDGRELRGFVISGSDGVWHEAVGFIDGNKVILSSPEVKEPAAVRFGWNDCPDVNLFNGVGLPVSPFRTF